MAEFFVLKGRLPNGARILVPAHSQDEDVMATLPNDQPLRVKVTRIRNPQFHRKYFALLNYAYENWEPDDAFATGKNFDRFRKDITILAGFYETHIRLNGEMRIEPKSISFAAMDDKGFEVLYNTTIDVIIKHVLKTYTGDQLREVLAQVEEFE